MVRIRVHDQLGVLLRFDGEPDWLWICQGRQQSQRMTDRWAHGPGWREIDPETTKEPPTHP